MNGKGGWSYYNPNAILKVIGPNLGLPKCVEELHLPMKDEKITSDDIETVPPLCKVIGDGMVQILSPSIQHSLQISFKLSAIISRR